MKPSIMGSFCKDQIASGPEARGDVAREALWLGKPSGGRGLQRGPARCG